ncbi:UNVERIFIED_ORG: hypothetical protein J2X79_002261 [Arthrobacter globiformis]|nr:hypothetical protein [Arthrobacter globiformis]
MRTPSPAWSRQRKSTAFRRRGIAGHRLKVREGDLVEVDGLRLTSVARRWVDLGSVLPIDDPVLAGDAIVSEHTRHLGPPKVTMVPLVFVQIWAAGGLQLPTNGQNSIVTGLLTSAS